MTVQIPDELIWNGCKHWIPEGGPLLQAWPKRRRPTFRPTSSACWRGYIARWIVDSSNWLRIASISTDGDTLTDELNDDVRKLFPGADTAVAAEWYSGELLVGLGEETEMPEPYVVVYPFYRMFSVQDGKVQTISNHDKNWWYEQHPDVDRTGEKAKRMFAGWSDLGH